MSPDVQWQVGEDQERETIARSTVSRRSRRSWIAILIVVILGAGLGVIYRSLPEAPALTPTPTPSPTPVYAPTPLTIPAALYQTIDREAQALADGDFDTYRRTQALGQAAGQPDNFEAWGRPRNGDPLYEIVEFNLLSESQAWADIRQFREGRYFRETRFYYYTGGQWRHGTPNITLWSGQTERLQTPHFDVTYALRDRGVLSPTLNQLEADYQSLCHNLGCAALPHELTLTVRFTSVEFPDYYPSNVLRLPSPRIIGYYESGRVYSWNHNPVHWILAQAIVAQVYGDGKYDRPGGGLLWAGSVWAIEHLDPLPEDLWQQLGDLSQKPLLSLTTLWEVGRLSEPGPALIQLVQLLRFIEHQYGAAAVTQLLGAIGSATSMSTAVETGLGVPFAEFDQQWQAWAKQNIARQ
jgi:hypothetical protein